MKFRSDNAYQIYLAKDAISELYFSREVDGAISMLTVKFLNIFIFSRIYLIFLKDTNFPWIFQFVPINLKWEERYTKIIFSYLKFSFLFHIFENDHR